jgi:hypothetical protein
MEHGEDNVLSDAQSDTTARGERIYKDYSKPDGEACRDDGTLKDASELEWPNSPSDSNPYNLNPGEENVILKRKPLGDEDDSGYENDELPKVKVSCNSLQKYL